MSTAVIVSGSLRQLVNASGSWTIPGDYFLIIDQDIYQTACTDVVGNSFEYLADIVKQSHVKFVSVFVSIDNKLPPNMQHNATVNMINKWMLASSNLVPYMVRGNYDKVIILRPDIYLNKLQPIRTLLERDLDTDTIYTTSALIDKDHEEWGVRPIMNDVLLMMTPQTFGKFAHNFLSFYMQNYNDTQTLGYEIHTMMAKFCQDNNYTVKPDLSNYFDFVILRNTSEHMFEYGSLKSEYSFKDLAAAEQEWWKNTYGK